MAMINQWQQAQQAQQTQEPVQLQYNAESGNFYAPRTDDGQNDGMNRGGMGLQQFGGQQQSTGNQAFTLSGADQQAIWERHQNSLLSQQQPGSVVERNGMQYVSAPPHVPNTLSPRSDARDNMAQVHRGMWEDYQRRFIPAESALMRSVGNHDKTMDQVRNSVRQAYGMPTRNYGWLQHADEIDAYLRGDEGASINLALAGGDLEGRAQHYREQSYVAPQGGGGILGQQERANRGLGVNMDPSQKQATERQHALGYSKAMTGATNTARMHLRDRDMATLGGGLGTLAQQRQDPGRP